MLGKLVLRQTGVHHTPNCNRSFPIHGITLIWVYSPESQSGTEIRMVVGTLYKSLLLSIDYQIPVHATPLDLPSPNNAMIALVILLLHQSSNARSIFKYIELFFQTIASPARNRNGPDVPINHSPNKSVKMLAGTSIFVKCAALTSHRQRPRTSHTKILHRPGHPWEAQMVRQPSIMILQSSTRSLISTP